MKEITWIHFTNVNKLAIEIPYNIHCHTGETLTIPVEEFIHSKDLADKGVYVAEASIKYFVSGIIKNISNTVIPVSVNNDVHCSHIKRIYVELNKEALDVVEWNKQIAENAGAVLDKHVEFE